MHLDSWSSGATPGDVRRSFLTALFSFVVGIGCDESSEDAWVHMQMCEEQCETTYDTCVCGNNYCDPMLSAGCSSEMIICSPESVPQTPNKTQCGASRDACLEKC